MRAWDTDQARAFLKATSSDRLGFAWSLLLTRGLRRGELCGLRWEDVDLTGGVVRINRSRVTVGGKPIDSVPKTASGRRSVPLDASLVALLKAHKAVQAAEQLAAGSAYDDSGYLVADELGSPCHPETVSGWFEAELKKAKLPRIRLHDTRHTAASLMLASGVPVKVVSEMLGHSSPTITLSIYAHVLPGMAEEAGAALSASLLG
jgi:integrase